MNTNTQHTPGSKLLLISERDTVARGQQLKVEREVTADTASEWLATFRKDEPGVSFQVVRQSAKTIAAWNRAAIAKATGAA